MRTALRYSVAFILLAGFLIYSCGFHVYFDLKISQIKKENYKGEKHADKLVKLDIPLSEIRWIEGHEFVWKGYIYDVYEKEIKDGRIICMAYKDKEETELVKDYKSQNEKKEQQLRHKSAQPFLSQASLVIPENQSQPRIYFPFMISEYFFLPHDCFSPPPECNT